MSTTIFELHAQEDYLLITHHDNEEVTMNGQAAYPPLHLHLVVRRNEQLKETITELVIQVDNLQACLAC